MLKNIPGQLKALLRNPWTYVFTGFYLLLVLGMPSSGFPGDVTFWKNWTESIHKSGVVALYNDPAVNYMPGFIYVLKAIGMALAPAGQVASPLLAIKAFTLLFDLGMAVLAWKILKKLQLPLARVLFILLNFALLYDTLIWGQVDSIPTFFALLAIWAGLNSRAFLSVISLLIAVNFKLQAVVFAPVVLILVLSYLSGWQTRVKTTLKLLVTVLAGEFLILLPFILAGQLDKIVKVITSAVGFYPLISLNANNFWLLARGPARIWQADSGIFFGGITYHNAGLIMFLIALLLVLLPMIILFFKRLRGQHIDWLQQRVVALVMLTAGLSAAFFFYFNTQMHERYLYPALIFFGIYSVIRNNYWSYLFLSLGFLLNMDSVLQWLPVSHTSFFWDPRLSATLITAAVGWGTIQLYHELEMINKQLNWRRNNNEMNALERNYNEIWSGKQA